MTPVITRHPWSTRIGPSDHRTTATPTPQPSFLPPVTHFPIGNPFPLGIWQLQIFSASFFAPADVAPHRPIRRQTCEERKSSKLEKTRHHGRVRVGHRPLKRGPVRIGGQNHVFSRDEATVRWCCVCLSIPPSVMLSKFGLRGAKGCKQRIRPCSYRKS